MVSDSSSRELDLTLRDYRAERPRNRKVATPRRDLKSELSVELALGLYKPEVDAVERTHSEHMELRVRVDKVLDEARPSGLACGYPRSPPSSSTIPGALCESGSCHSRTRRRFMGYSRARGTAPGDRSGGRLTGRLPRSLRHPRDADLLPTLNTEECSPAEASRRTEVGTLILRRRQIAGSRGFPQSLCLKCDLPLSDATSVSIGLGPECRRHFSRRAVGDLQSGNPQRRFFIGARRPKQWV